MTKLEEKIIKKVYTMETKSFLLSFFVKVSIFVMMALLAVFSGQIIIEVFKEQGTFDLFELFKEDLEIIKRYFFDVVVEFYQETPKLALILTAIAVFILILIISTIIKNRRVIINKVGSLLRFWEKNKK